MAPRGATRRAGVDYDARLSAESNRMGEQFDAQSIPEVALNLPISLPGEMETRSADMPTPVGLHAASPTGPEEEAAPRAPILLVGEGEPITTPSANREIPSLLRLWRLLTGAAMLAVAWGFLLLLIVLVNWGWRYMHGTRLILLRAGAAAGAAIAVTWLALAVLACVLAGAFSLMLAASRRSW